ncbi:MAG: lipid-A-disaccharide synthase [Bdellovibrionales bacterium]
MTERQEPPLFFLVAGEASGDLLGARLMAALKKRTGGYVRFAGVGGPRMEQEGLDLLFPQSDLAHMGLFELVRHLPLLLRRIHQTIDAVKKQKPAALITIDSPDFCFRVAKKLKGQGIPLIHYVAPTVWAWRPGRAKKIAQFLDHLLALLPFEPPYFTKEGLPCTFVGHPLVESAAGQGNAERFRTKFGIGANVPLLAVLPGSRMGEVKRLLPIFCETVLRVRAQYPGLELMVPTVAHIEKRVREEMKNWGIPVHFTTNDEDKYDGFAACMAALACSGTVSVELAMSALPTVIAYKIGALTAFLYRRLIKTRFATLVNIMHDKEIMPEFLQEKCEPEKMAEAVLAYLSNPKVRQDKVKELTSIAQWLGRGQFVPSERAADTVWRVAFKGEGSKG